MQDYGLASAEWSRDRRDPPEPEPVTRCFRCHAGIYEGEHYYIIGGDTLCEDCVASLYRRIASGRE